MAVNHRESICQRTNSPIYFPINSPSPNIGKLIRLLVFAAICFATVDISANETIRYNLLLLSNSRQANDQLQRTVRMNAWENVPLRTCIEGQLASFGLTCWIDRRVDANQLVSVEFPATTLEQCLQKIAATVGAQVGLVENVVVFAPAEQLASMERAAVLLHDQLSRASGDSSSVRQQGLQWPMLVTPTELLAQISRLWDVELQNSLPHDLMAKGKLPACTLATQLTLLLGGFDKQVVFADHKFAFQTLNAASDWQAVYAADELRPDAISLIAKQKTRNGLKTKQRSLPVDGPSSFHRKLLARPSTGPTRDRGGKLLERKLSSFVARDKPVAEVVEHIANNLDLQVSWDERIAESVKQQLISLDMKDIRLEELLAQVGTAARLSIKLSSGVIVVAPIEE